MSTRFDGNVNFFLSQSLANLANSGVGNGVAAGDWGWSISNLTAFNHTLSASESGAANVAKALTTLIYDLAHRGLIRATGLPG
jgi:hypothetical protein